MSEEIIAFTRGIPATESFPIQKLITCSQEVLAHHGKAILQYGKGAGYLPLRERIAEQYKVKADNIIIGQGSLQIVDHICRVRAHQGDQIIVEQPTYDRVLTLLRRTPVNIVGMNMDEDGVDVDALRGWLQKNPKPNFLYAIPDFQNPSGIVYSLEKRRALLDLADHFDFLIIEDAPYRELRYEGKSLPSLFDLSPERVIHLSSFSKTISPGLRVGYAIAPLALAQELASFAEGTYINVSALNQAIVECFISHGWFERNMQKLKELYYPRLLTLLESLDVTMQNYGIWDKPQGGFFVGMHLRKTVNFDDLLEQCAFNGLAISDGRGFFVQGGEDFIRLPFCALQSDELVDGIHRLTKALKTIF